MGHTFRVVVVGGGVSGLVASHCLHRIGIEHVVLERGSEAAPPEGASIAIYPHGARILDQIGCLEAAKQACTPMSRFINRLPNGAATVDSGFFDYVKENFGEDILLLERREFLRLLYENLPNKSAIRFNQKVLSVEDDHEGVTVHLGNGEKLHADMVIGCDGVHSAVREAMWRNANASIPGYISAREKKSVSTSWSCLIGVGPPNAGMGTRDMTCVHNDGFSFLVLSQPDKIFFFVFFRLNETSYWPDRLRYTAEHADRAAASVSGYPISSSTLFGELWNARYRGAMVGLEEGILEHWFYDRIVLAGDAAHKITPNIALGGNSSMESIVTLVNGLETMLQEHAGAKPSRATLKRVFTEYQRARKPRMHDIMQYSSLLTKLQAWDNPVLRFAATWVVPYLPDRIVADDLSKRFIATAPKLDRVPVSPSFGKGALVQFADYQQPNGVSPAPTSSVPPTTRLRDPASSSSTSPKKLSVLVAHQSDWLAFLGKPDLFPLLWAVMALLTVVFWLSGTERSS